MLEPELQIKCRKDDLKDIQGMTSYLEEKYSTYMKEQTEGRNGDYKCSLHCL